ncbi:Ctr domain-containing protein [Cephalotus follicularis]|uniref:Copper transport protein n=1 Tax=Cephalotus follicularis TaxID=3775 RepID=A0A1Q3CDK0_CEPFO|nr:Ctr domain-containing protein [Cephalotus follicularis]
MAGMEEMAPSPQMFNGPMMRHRMMMHMAFYWGTEAEVLFSDWPGRDKRMYAVSLVLVFVLAFLAELTHCRFFKPHSNHVVARFFQTFLHCIRVGLNYLVMLALMSFNAGVYLVAVAGHTLGFFLFGSRVFMKSSCPAKTSDIPPMSC